MEASSMNPADTFVAPQQFFQQAPETAEELYTTVSFDPGETTGWAVFAVRRSAIDNYTKKILSNIVWWSTGEFEGKEDLQVDEMMLLIDAWPQARIVSESFVLRKFSRDEELLSPVRILSKLEYGLHLRGAALITQQPSLAKTTITDDRLKALGFWTGLSTHQRDAVRHGFTWMRRAKELVAATARSGR